MSGGFDDARIVGEPFVERSGVRVPQDVGTEYLGGLNDPAKGPVDGSGAVAVIRRIESIGLTTGMTAP